MPARRRHLRARRSRPRTSAPSGWSSGCRTRRRASLWPAGWRRASPSDSHVVLAHSGGRERRATMGAASGDRPRCRLLAVAHRANATRFGTTDPTELRRYYDPRLMSIDLGAMYRASRHCASPTSSTTPLPIAPVPATPAWQAQEVVAHARRGDARHRDAATWKVLTTDPWTAAQVERAAASPSPR